MGVYCLRIPVFLVVANGHQEDTTHFEGSNPISSHLGGGGGGHFLARDQ